MTVKRWRYSICIRKWKVSVGARKIELLDARYPFPMNERRRGDLDYIVVGSSTLLFEHSLAHSHFDNHSHSNNTPRLITIVRKTGLNCRDLWPAPSRIPPPPLCTFLSVFLHSRIGIDAIPIIARHFARHSRHLSYSLARGYASKGG